MLDHPHWDDPQRALHELLRAELLHTLGSYGLVTDKLEQLRDALTTDPPEKAGNGWHATIRTVVNNALECNERLRTTTLHPSHLRVEHESVLLESEAAAFPRHPPPTGSTRSINGQWIVDFYQTAITALESVVALDPKRDIAQDGPDVQLGLMLRRVHDPQRRDANHTDPEVVRGRIARNRKRLQEAADLFGRDNPKARATEILQDHLKSQRPGALHLKVIDAFSEAHLCMHRAEHHLSHSFGDKIEYRAKLGEEAETELRRSLVLNTFVYVVGRSLPWIFAEDEDERDYVLQRYPECCESLTPTYCMWIAREISLLALHRRAYTWWLLGKPDRAYRDFHKLVRFMRGLRTRLEQRASRAPGAMTLVEGLSAIAEHHTGRIYRSQHAHKVAVQYFERAVRRMDLWADDEEVAPILRDSRWRTHLLLSQGKAYYELGRVKDALQAYLLAWSAYLELAGSEGPARTNLHVVKEVLAWIKGIESDPDLNKLELRRQIAPLVQQFETVLGPAHLRLLAADIMMRLGHLLYILKLPSETDWSRGFRDVDHMLAMRCVWRAADLDRSSTLVAADLLKIPYFSKHTLQPPHAVPEMAPLAAQWPAGGGSFDEAARVVEYVLQTWLQDAPNPDEELDHRAVIARGLLASFLAHTDSSNVKLAQVYRYLMQGSRDSERLERLEGSRGLDLVCMRRYSSFFPFLPRPTSFQASGGGYFVQVYDPKPYGVVIDPGPNFLDNLYRCGYCLEDIHMIVVTHDHADHMASLDALLSLLGYRDRVDSDRGRFSPRQRLAIVGNASVVDRYAFFDNEQQRASKRPDAVRVMDFATMSAISSLRGEDRAAAADAKDVGILLDAETLQIEPVITYDHRDAGRNAAQGFRISVGDGPQRATVLFTSDTGPPEDPIPDDDRLRSGGDVSLLDAVRSADVVVAHLSSVPLGELRSFAGLEEAPASTRALTAEFERIWESARRQATGTSSHAEKSRFLLSQLQFGFRARPVDTTTDPLTVSPLSPLDQMSTKTEKHLYLSGLFQIAEAMHAREDSSLLLVGELREELGSFRTRIAAELNAKLFKAPTPVAHALTADIGLKVRVVHGSTHVLCSTCDLDNDLVEVERYHEPEGIVEVCVKGESEGVFYNCGTHNPRHGDTYWVEAVERYDLFAE